MSRLIALACLACFALTSFDTASADSNWPRWRGPNQDGHSTETGFPRKWSPSDVKWKTPLPGAGQSSPIIWGEQLFLTAALDRGAERVALCVDRNTGDIVWQTSLWKGRPEDSHAMNGWASSTCVTDGERVWCFFGQGGGLFCLSMDGKQIWNRDLGEFPGPWGTAASPVLIDNMLIQNCDSDDKGFLLAVDKLTGDTLWTAQREQQRGWSTPILIEAVGRRELVVQGHTGIRAYNPANGEEYWRTTGTKGRGTPTVTPANGLVYVIPGRGPSIFAVKPGGKGDVTASNVVWNQPRKGRDLPSPIIVGNFLLAMSMQGGILTCYNATTGEQLWSERIGGTVTASPIAYDGLVAFIEDGGEALVVEPADTLKVVSRCNLQTDDEEIFRASITPSGGQFFIRSTKNLYCIGK
ncbi:MAG: PQQ-like beta-propeller repeat protein [Planctomycetota bacterium]|nr:PQQ-like beta-propeller repeat protein [Planctomycetota bacterium]MDA0921387.1 PQQ-like beta-propeller repeat protein [Planctomycetota bacterium]